MTNITVAELKEMIKNLNDTDEVVFIKEVEEKDWNSGIVIGTYEQVEKNIVRVEKKEA